MIITPHKSLSESRTRLNRRSDGILATSTCHCENDPVSHFIVFFIYHSSSLSFFFVFFQLTRPCLQHLERFFSVLQPTNIISSFLWIEKAQTQLQITHTLSLF